MTEHAGSTNGSISGEKILCKCRKFTGRTGLCPHALAVADKNGTLAEYLTKLNSCQGKLKKNSFHSSQKGLERSRKKRRKGRDKTK